MYLTSHLFRTLALSLVFTSSLLAGNPTEPTNTPTQPATQTRVLYTVSQTRLDIVNFAQVHTGVRYVHAGRSLNGFDCSGFTSYVLKYFDFNVSASSTKQATEGKAISFAEARPGDLIFFGGKNYISHVAMVVENDGEHLMVVHSTSSRGVVVEDVLASKYWKPKMKFARNVLND